MCFAQIGIGVKKEKKEEKQKNQKLKYPVEWP